MKVLDALFWGGPMHGKRMTLPANTLGYYMATSEDGVVWEHRYAYNKLYTKLNDEQHAVMYYQKKKTVNPNLWGY